MSDRNLVLLAAVLTTTAYSQTRPIPLDPDAMKLVNIKAEKATWKGRPAVRLTDAAAGNVGDDGRIAVINATAFQDGVIEVDLTGDTKPDAPPLSRGFTGIAFRVAAGGGEFECFYLRPKNGRAEDQEQRNHSVQYISVPGFPWQMLRKEFPSKYESYADLVPGDWTKVKIDVRGSKARLYVHGSEQPVLIVNDLKRGSSKGAIALWIGPGTVAHFSNLRVMGN